LTSKILSKNEFIASFARFLFLIWCLKCKNLIYLQLKFVKLFCKNNVIIAGHTVASQKSSDITNEFCVLQKFTQPYSKNFTYEVKQKYCNLNFAYTVKKNSCEITAFIAGYCVFCGFNKEFTNKINKITNKTNKITKIVVFLSVLYAILLIFFVNSLLKQQSTQLPAMKAGISHENF
jgi:hypothetical protein